MNIEVINAVKSQLFKAVSGSTKKDVYFLVLPNEEVQSRYNVVFELKTRDITHAMDAKEVLLEYDLNIIQMFANYETLLTNAVFIKAKMYDLVNVNSDIPSVSLSDENIEYDSDKNVYRTQHTFEVHFAKN